MIYFQILHWILYFPLEKNISWKFQHFWKYYNEGRTGPGTTVVVEHQATGLLAQCLVFRVVCKYSAVHFKTQARQTVVNKCVFNKQLLLVGVVFLSLHWLERKLTVEITWTKLEYEGPMHVLRYQNKLHSHLGRHLRSWASHSIRSNFHAGISGTKWPFAGM